jgi:hypothetical protein
MNDKSSSLEWRDLRDMLRGVWLRKDATAAELRDALEKAQLALETLWDTKPLPGPPPIPGHPQCGMSGCNYRRYPASPFCMYHVTSNDTLAARLRRAERRSRSS